jgi:hypothetical protein
MYAYDFSRKPGPSVREIIDAEGQGILGYSGNSRQDDDLLDEYRRAGLYVVWIWEVDTDSIFGGYDYAVEQCKWHEKRVPQGELTYVACDTRKEGDVVPFLRGWGDTTREDVFGLYGPDFAIKDGQDADTKCQRWWGVVNWIKNGKADNHPDNITYWMNAGAHIIQLIGSPISDTDQNLICKPDWHSVSSTETTKQRRREDVYILLEYISLYPTGTAYLMSPRDQVLRTMVGKQGDGSLSIYGVPNEAGYLIQQGVPWARVQTSDLQRLSIG